MKIKTNQNGFSAIDIILVIVAVGAIGVAVYFAVFHKTTVTTTKTVTVTKSAPAATVTANVLQIPELGIQMTLPSGLAKSDVYYVASTKPVSYTDATGKNSYTVLGDAILSTHSLTTQYANCAASLSKVNGSPAGLMTLVKYQQNPQTLTIASPDTNVVPIGNFYMAIADHQSDCSSGSDTSFEDNQTKLLQQAYATISAIK